MHPRPSVPTLPEAPAAGASKERWRTWARIVRRRLVTPERSRPVADALAAWPPYRDAGTVLLYLAFGSEVDLSSLTVDRRKRLLVPRSNEAPGAILHVHDLATARLERTAYGPLQPVAATPDADPRDVEVVLVPGLCFDRGGTRLGYGRGYFDRFLATLPARVPRVGVTLDALVVERLPIEAHDAPMTHLATESGVREVAARRSDPEPSPSRRSGSR